MKREQGGEGDEEEEGSFRGCASLIVSHSGWMGRAAGEQSERITAAEDLPCGSERQIWAFCAAAGQTRERRDHKVRKRRRMPSLEINKNLAFVFN